MLQKESCGISHQFPKEEEFLWNAAMWFLIILSGVNFFAAIIYFHVAQDAIDRESSWFLKATPVNVQ